MAYAHYFIDFRSVVADIDEEEEPAPWHQAVPQLKPLVVLFILSMVIACAYPLSFEEIFGRL